MRRILAIAFPFWSVELAAREFDGGSRRSCREEREGLSTSRRGDGGAAMDPTADAASEGTWPASAIVRAPDRLAEARGADAVGAAIQTHGHGVNRTVDPSSSERARRHQAQRSGAQAGQGWRHPRTVASVWAASMPGVSTPPSSGSASAQAVVLPSSRAAGADAHPPTLREQKRVTDAPRFAGSRDERSRELDRPMLVVVTSHGVRTVIGVCPRGLGAGVRAGMPLVQARALLGGDPRRQSPDPSSQGRSSPMSASTPSRPSGLGDAAGEPCFVVEHDAHRSEMALRSLAAWLVRHVPLVSLATTTDDASAPWRDPAEASLWADISGCERLLEQRYARGRGGPCDSGGSIGDASSDPTSGGEMMLMRFLQERFRQRGLTARLAIGSTPGVAWAVARYGPQSVRRIPPGDERSALDPLPIESLRLAASDAAALREVHVERVRQLLALDRGELGERLGHGVLRSGRGGVSTSRSGKRTGHVGATGMGAGGRRRRGVGRSAEASDGGGESTPDPLQRIDQALGHLPEPLLPLRVVPPCRVRCCFDGPVADPEVVELASADLVDRLCRRVRRYERGVTRLRWRAERTGLPPLDVEFDVGAPTRRRAHLWALLQPHLEQLDDGLHRLRDRYGRGGDLDGDRFAMGLGIESITLTAVRTAAIAHRQGRSSLLTVAPPPSSLPIGDDGHAATALRRVSGMRGMWRRGAWHPSAATSECLDLLVARFGRACVLRAIMVESHEPERAFRLEPFHGAPSHSAPLHGVQKALSGEGRHQRPIRRRTGRRPTGGEATASATANATSSPRTAALDTTHLGGLRPDHPNASAATPATPRRPTRATAPTGITVGWGCRLPEGHRPPWLLSLPEPIRLGPVDKETIARAQRWAGDDHPHLGDASVVPQTIVTSIRGSQFWWRGRWRVVVHAAGWECIDEPWWTERSSCLHPDVLQRSRERLDRTSNGDAASGKGRWGRSGIRLAGHATADASVHVGTHRDAGAAPRSPPRSVGPRAGESSRSDAMAGGPFGSRPPAISIAAIPSPIASSVVAESHVRGPLPPEFFSLRRWYCRALCDDGVWLWIFCATPPHPERVPTVGGAASMWWVHGGWL